MKRPKLAGVAALIAMNAAVMGWFVAHGAEKQNPPTISGYLAAPVMAAQEQMNKHNYAGAIILLKSLGQARSTDKSSFSETMGNVGKQTAYDQYILTQMLAISYYSSNDPTDAAPLLHEAAVSPYSPPEQTKQFLTTDMHIYYETLKNYPACVAAGQELIQRGLADSDIYTTIALAQMAQDKNKEAAQTIQEIINKQPKPEEKLLTFAWNAYTKVNDTANADEIVQQLVKYYPKPEYWVYALSTLSGANIQDAHLMLDVFRLMDSVGVLTQPEDCSDMAELAIDQGNPREAVNLLQKAFADQVFTDPRDVAHYQRLLSRAQQSADAEQKGLSQQVQQAQSAPAGDDLVSVGAAYLSYGQADKAVDLVTQGIAKGHLKYPEQANLLLGMAELQAHQAVDAQHAFEKVQASSNQRYVRLGRLWALHAAGVANN